MTKQKSEMEKAPKKVFRYVGRRTVNQSFSDCFIELDEKLNPLDPDRLVRWHVGRGNGTFIIGMVYRIPCTDKYSVWLRSATPMPDAPEVSDGDRTAWAFLDQAARDERDAGNAYKRQEKKARTAYASTLDKLQPIYNKMNYDDRAAMLRVIGDVLRKGANYK